MNLAELEDLSREIRLGKVESASIDWKRQWWKLSEDEGKEEFRRDVASLANSADPVGILLIGVKNRALYDGSPPLDEAAIQQIAAGIVPSPRLTIEPHVVEGKTISVISVGPPFDRPHVTTWKGHNVVFVRRASSVDTATRFQLDQFYLGRNRQPSLGVEWQFWPPGSIVSEDDDAETAPALPLCAPSFGFQDVKAACQKRLAALRASQSSESYPSATQLQEYEAELNRFLDCLGRPDNFLHWFITRQTYLAATPFTVTFRNNGNAPATEVKLRLELPEWLLVVDDPRIPDPEGYFEEPALPSRPPPTPTPFERLFPQFHQYRDPLADLDLAFPTVPRIGKDSGAWADGNHVARFWADKVLHANPLVAEDHLRMLALPGAPVSDEPIRVKASIFSVEQETWLPVEMRVQLVPCPAEVPLTNRSG